MPIVVVVPIVVGFVVVVVPKTLEGDDLSCVDNSIFTQDMELFT